MKARLIQHYYGGTWVGQVWNEKKKRWSTVTCQCLTRIGARIEIGLWRRRTGVNTFEV